MDEKLKIPGEKISFQCIELKEAEKIYKEYLNTISKIIKGITEVY